MLRHGWLIASALSLFSPLAFAQDIAPGGTLRAAYLASNPAQAVRDPVSGEIRGASADLARELARRHNKPLVFMPLTNPPAVIEAVAKGDADIGFVAYAPERVGTVEFSQIYMLVQQSFIVPDGSPIRAVADIDARGRRLRGQPPAPHQLVERNAWLSSPAGQSVRRNADDHRPEEKARGTRDH